MVALLAGKPTKWLRLFFVPKHLVMLIMCIKLTLDIEQKAFTMNPIRRTNLHSNVELVTLLTLCTNFQVFARFAIFADEVVLLIFVLQTIS